MTNPKPPMRDCQPCKHFNHPTDLTNPRSKAWCNLGHVVRFYIPKTPTAEDAWGWRRRCADYSEEAQTND